MCTMAAPASAAPRQAPAICSGVIGRYGVCSGVVRLPVTAQVMKILSRGSRIMEPSEGPAAIDHNGRAGRECEMGGAGENGRSNVVRCGDPLQRCGGSRPSVEIRAASGDETGIDDPGRNGEN